MRVLLCHLTDQHVPNLLSVHHYKPDQLVLIESQDMHKRSMARHFLNALKFGDLDYDARYHIESLGAEDNLAAVRQALQRAYGKFSAAEWIANLTGGTKPMSIATYEFFKALGGKLVYTNVTRPATLIDLESGQTEECNHRLPIKEFLAGYGFESRKADDKIAEAEHRARGWAPSAKLLAKHACDQDILHLNDQEREAARGKGTTLPVEKFRFPAEAQKELRRIWLDGQNSRELTKYEVQFLTGGWLEVFFWNLLSHHANTLGIWDVRLGLEVRRCGDRSGNDFDVSFMHDYSLSMIECKSGAQDHDPGTDILYKIEAVTRQFRALRVRSYLATTSSNVLDKDQKIKLSLRTRSEIYNCKILTASEIIQLASESVTADQIKAVLFGHPHK